MGIDNAAPSCRPRTGPPAFLEQHMATGRHAEETGPLAETGPHASRHSSGAQPAAQRMAAGKLA